MEKKYDELAADLAALCEGVENPVSLLANASALLWQRLGELNWAGFYLAAGELLELGPFQGKPACVRIPFGKGVCGTAADRDETQRVPDVHLFPGHIACDGASRSELVVPLHKDGRVCGVLDLDSPVKERFTPGDQEGLEAFARVLERFL